MVDWVKLKYKYRNPINLDRISAQEAEKGKQGTVKLEAVENKVHIKRRAEFLADPDETYLFGLRHLSDTTYVNPESYTAHYNDALVTGFRTILTRDGFWTNDLSLKEDEEHNFLQGRREAIGEDTDLIRMEDGYRFDPRRDKRTIKISGRVVLLTSNEPSNYGSFIFRVLPKLVGLKAAKNTRFLVYARETSFRDLLNLAGVPDDLILQHDPHLNYECEHLIVRSVRSPSAFLDNPTRIFFDNIKSRALSNSKPLSRIKSLYVSRLTSNRSQKRKLLNEQDLVDTLLNRGFHVVNPAKLTINEQISIFDASELVVGPSGSGMFNVVFCRKGTQIIDIESEPHWIHAHSNLFASCELRFGIFSGKSRDNDWSDHHKEWSVNIPRLIELIDTIPRSSEA